ncbi:PREDICTED: 52 kDa repressor of the inhibitor of the protein kinase-like isoform X2 [Trachymyrmex cornetzi]|uniref:52 kDa repressor of the inhibitor of the protein kinase-like isoform X2 n=1 Tax=Trachymyrmex cornetzi TaxID=471704 RepID=UPI00084EF638|nr:PREDICTED: 52 kDa repressor of the inhibitor of the protein kinase-like isoform X2 [Trachymyrmex cornetzi]
MSKGGFSCVMCKNISGRNAGIKFFRFPKDPEMSKLWLKSCNRMIDRTTEELYKNYRICSDHFNENMYLNDLKTRLLPAAIPNATQTTSNFLTNPTCDTYVISRENIEFRQKSYQEELEIKANESLYEQMDLGESNNSTDGTLIEPDERNISRGEIASSKLVHKQIQTPQNLSHDSPRKNRLKSRIVSLQRENRKLKQQLKNALTKSDREDLKYYCQLTDKFLFPSAATFVKEQAKLNQQLTKE